MCNGISSRTVAAPEEGDDDGDDDDDVEEEDVTGEWWERGEDVLTCLVGGHY